MSRDNFNPIYEDEQDYNLYNNICSYTNYILKFIILLLVIADIVYIISGIIFLIEDKNIIEICNYYNLWIYILVSVILLPLLIISLGLIIKYIINIDYINNENLLILLIMIILTDTILLVYGSQEIYTNYDNCTNSIDIKETNIWTFGKITFNIEIISIIITFIIFLYNIIHKLSNNNNNN